MNNVNIVKSVIANGNWFNGTAEVFVMSSDKQVQICTKNIFIRMTELEHLKAELEKWEKVEDIEVSPMPLRNHALAVTILFS